MSINLKFSPNILRQLGEELVPSLDQSILELVKNSYDADASNCTIELQNTDIFGGSVIIRDNGSGMDDTDIEKKWLLLGKSQKEKSKRTPIYKRIPVGDKGLGRLSALRLGHKVEVISRPRKKPGWEYSITVNWDLFDKVDAVEDIPLEVHKRKTSKPHGTEIVISNLRRPIQKREVESLSRSVLLITGPFDQDKTFKPELKVPEFKELQEIVNQTYFESAVYKLVVEKGAAKAASCKVYDGKKKNHIIWQSSIKNDHDTVPFKFEFWVFILDEKKFTSEKIRLRELRAWLQLCGGVYLFEGGMRVQPYGDPGNDWLDINLRRTQSPEERPSTLTSAGRIIVDNGSGKLVQKTDRFGYVENTAFVTLKRYVSEGLEFMATQRLKVAEKLRAEKKKEVEDENKNTEAQIEKALEDSVKTKSGRQKVKSAVKKALKAKDKETLALKTDLHLYRSLATVGMASAVFAHEIGKPLTGIADLLDEISTDLKKAGADYLNESIGLTSKSIDKLKKYAILPLSLLKKERRRPVNLVMQKSINGVLNLFEPILEDSDISVKLSISSRKQYLVAGSQSLIDGIFINLFSNSITAFQRDFVDVDSREIVIQADDAKKSLFITYTDNAGGIAGVDTNDIWLPGVTTEKNGTGLGLTIVRDCVTDMGGKITARKKTEFGGAEFTIELPLKQK